MKDDFGWWESLNQEEEETRIKINEAFNHRISGMLKVALVSAVLMSIAMVISFLQSHYVVDQIGIMLLIVEVFVFGTIGGLSIGNVQTEWAFKQLANERKSKELR